MLRIRCHVLTFVTTIAPAVALAATVSAQEYEVTDLGATGTFNYAWSLNQHGDVAGISYDEHYLNGEGFVYVQGHLRYVGAPGGGGTSSVVAINNLGHAAGTLNGSQGSEAFIWIGHRVRLGTLGGNRSYGHCINDLGQAVGLAALPDNSLSGFIWEDGEMRPLPIWPAWINNNDQIVGGAMLLENGELYQLPGPGHAAEGWYIHDNGDIAGAVRITSPGGYPVARAAVWRDRELVLLLGTLADERPFEGEGMSIIKGINADGVIVGMSTNATYSAYVPFLYRDGAMVQLDDLMPEPWVALDVFAGSINDAGQIAVTAKIPGVNGIRALLLTPIDSCPADIDGDGDTDQADLGLLLSSYQVDDGGDLDGDGDTDQADLGILLADYNCAP
ncbi:MAG: hypothetical protein ACF8NJ_01660 [Phycisphaerales bacterium JB038]